MKWQHSVRSQEDYASAPAKIQRAFDKQVRPLAANLLYPSLRAKKYDESLNLWQARVNRDWRVFLPSLAGNQTILCLLSRPQQNYLAGRVPKAMRPATSP